MAEGDDKTAPPPGQAELLRLWEQGAAQSGVGQALALLSAARPETPPDMLAVVSIGCRDRELLDLHDRLFGSRIECTADCAECGRVMEAVFESSDIRSRSCPPETFRASVRGTIVEARLPDSSDLAAVEGMADAREAWRALLERCIVSARRRGKSLCSSDLPDELLEAVDVAAADADPQADVVLNLACPDCGAETKLLFDIARQAWAKLDHWARAMVSAVDVIAARYGWSEAEILAQRPARRRLYLEVLGR